MNVVCCAIGNMDKARDRSSDVKQGVDLYGSLSLAKFRPTRKRLDTDRSMLNQNAYTGLSMESEKSASC